MHIDQQKEQFSGACIKAVAACAGFAWSTPSVDDDSVDVALHQTGGGGSIRSPRLELQVKCKAAITPVEDEFSFWVKKKNYDDLRDSTVQVPRVLVVVLVPEDVTDWVSSTETELALRRCGYWLSLRGMPDATNPTGQTIRMRRAQVFTVAELAAIMVRVSHGALP